MSEYIMKNYKLSFSFKFRRHFTVPDYSTLLDMPVIFLSTFVSKQNDNKYSHLSRSSFYINFLRMLRM